MTRPAVKAAKDMTRPVSYRESFVLLAAWLAAVFLWIVFSPGILFLIDQLAEAPFR